MGSAGGGWGRRHDSSLCVDRARPLRGGRDLEGLCDDVNSGGNVRFITDGKGPAKELVLTIVEGDIKGTRKK